MKVQVKHMHAMHELKNFKLKEKITLKFDCKIYFL